MEQAFYSDSYGVYVSNVRAILGSTTYAMSQISSVTAYQRPPNRASALITAGVGLLSFGLVLIPLVAVEQDRISTMLCTMMAAVPGLVCLAVAVYLWVSKKTVYWIRLTTSGGQVDALSSTDYGYANAVRLALTQALLARG